jgi:2-polyprenyl-3-methyl-5-hydroxy-6-metoxy-1,4-benzoquinol methylase
MRESKVTFFDEAATHWDAVPQRIELAKAVGNAILCQVYPSHNMDVLDYGCGTGLLGLFLLPHVQSVTGADSSPRMLQVLNDKIQTGGLQQMRGEQLDLTHDPVPDARYHLIVANMVMHHVGQIGTILKAFHQMLLPGGSLAIADLDTEPGVFHGPDAAESVYHHGFDRRAFMDHLYQAGFVNVSDVTAHVIRKPIADGQLRKFPVFLIVGHRDERN